jgi:16S rRNA (adenine1518-N6/adenine1519-N6)-dimethyltransferase
MRRAVKKAEHGPQLRASRRLSQNFLIAERVADRIVASFAPAAEDHVIEIGPGHGILTDRLAGRVRRLEAIELDRRLAEALADRHAGSPGVAVHHADFLRQDLARFGPSLRVLSNLPYGIATPVLVKLVAEPSVQDAVLTLQREFAERLAAPCATKAYGSISVLVQLNARVESLFDIPAHAFRPRPKVVSRCVRLVFDRLAGLPAGAERALREVTRSAFSGRRKRLAKALSLGLGLTGGELEQLMRAAGVDPELRPDALEPHGYLKLATALCQRLAHQQGPGQLPSG